MSALLSRLQSTGPKRILALDGGGIRGALTIGFLKRIETILRGRYDRPELVLADYFDLIGGTSTGAIIAAALAIGMSADEVRAIYLDFGGEVFNDRTDDLGIRRFGLLRGRYSAEPLRRKLGEYFEDKTLGDESVKTGLCIVTKRADTNSTWPFHNHPLGKYFAANQGLLLRRIVRASTAAPTYFDPEQIDIGEGLSGAFVDGGVSLHNNPSLLLFLVATLRGFPFQWPVGERNLLLVSVGTGFWDQAASFQDVMGAKLWNWASSVPAMLMDDANWLNQLMLQYLSNSPTRLPIDEEVGELETDFLGGAPLLTYLRYNIRLEAKALTELGLPAYAERAESLREMSRAENRSDLDTLGSVAALKMVKEEHFVDFFDPHRRVGA
ncbi:patatin-like phospholipase family protein [Bradyrhizobium guangzhouense]|uniref:Patatin n=1 Tax=Bradyrhizobium guangzhouense TaxID=1325095 RepID=A0AAE5X6C5_9BRAD|nr:patatin-like phospholipase family protein [Bradyrhizobium guangzhouense]QAU49672.1 patatin [Bradyrhizobium guangzhouense]